MSSQESKYSWKIQEWFPELSSECISKLSVIHRELFSHNDSLGLVPSRTLRASDAIHFADCIKGSRLIFSDCSPDKVLDIGSGGGFPGLVFAALYPQVKVYLNELDGKRAEFLKETATLAGISNAEVIRAPIDKLPENSVRVAMSRGVAPIAKMAIAARKCVMKGGALYLFKTEEWGREVADIPIQLCSHWTPALVDNYSLPTGAGKLAIVRLSKMSD